MKTRYFRLFYIFWVIARYKLYVLIPRSPANKKIIGLLQCLFMLNPLAWWRQSYASRGQRLRQALITLGPIFVKFGQILSTRPDLLPEDIVKELSKLQDSVPPFSHTKAMAILQHEYSQPLSEVFPTIDDKPLASASIAQVYGATLYDANDVKSDVVIKIVRPNIEKIIKKDIQVLFLLAELANKKLAQAKLLRLPEVVAEFETTILKELDMRLEAENASKLRQNFETSKILYVPKVYWPLVRKNILVMERIYGIAISDIATLQAKGANFKKLAQDGVEIFYTQVFRDRFFHADMHPGNIFVNVDNPQNPVYCGIDFGIMGVLNEQDNYYMGENFLAFFNRDYHRVAELHIESGWVPADTNLKEFEQAIKTIFDPMFKKPLNEVSFGQVLISLLKVAQQFNMVVQPQLVLLQKTLLNVEGLGRQLYPQLDLWETAKPHLERIMGKKITLLDRFKLFTHRCQKISFDLEKLPETIRAILGG